jgi:hypothetical protein
MFEHRCGVRVLKFRKADRPAREIFVGVTFFRLHWKTPLRVFNVRYQSPLTAISLRTAQRSITLVSKKGSWGPGRSPVTMKNDISPFTAYASRYILFRGPVYYSVFPDVVLLSVVFSAETGPDCRRALPPATKVLPP